METNQRPVASFDGMRRVDPVSPARPAVQIRAMRPAGRMQRYASLAVMALIVAAAPVARAQVAPRLMADSVSQDFRQVIRPHPTCQHVHRDEAIYILARAPSP